jgi:hypothetical protein
VAVVVHKCCDHTTKSQETLKMGNENGNENKNEMVNKMEKMWRVNEERRSRGREE